MATEKLHRDRRGLSDKKDGENEGKALSLFCSYR